MKDGNYNLESVYTSKVRAGKRRTYFFDVRETRGNDYYITLTESTKRFNGDGVERHKIFVYEETTTPSSTSNDVSEEDVSW